MEDEDEVRPLSRHEQAENAADDAWSERGLED